MVIEIIVIGIIVVIGIYCAIEATKICFNTFREMVFDLSEECEK